MEKFTVDLDKVLDEFEFNEEQAAHHALHQYKREELPASRYKKPHFKPINMADADFSPSIETTMSYPNYQNNHTEASINTVNKPEVTTNNYKINELEQLTSDDLIEADEESGCESDETDSYEEQDFQEEKLSVLNHEAPIASNSVITQNIIVEEEIEVQKNKSINRSEIIDNNVDNVVKIDDGVDAIVIDTSVNEIIENVENEDDRESSIEVADEVECLSAQEMQIKKPDLIENKSINTNSYVEAKGITKLPDLTEVGQEKLSEAETVNIKNLDLIKDKREFEEEIKLEYKNKNIVNEDLAANQEDSLEPVEVAEVVLPTENASSGGEEPSSDSDNLTSGNGEPEIKPIQFESEIDITDEELQKYLEELEEEEERERKTEESKLERPQSLSLNKTVVSQQFNSPLPRSLQEPEAVRSEIEGGGLRNDREGETRAEVGSAMDAANDLETFIEASIASRAAEETLTIGERRLGKVSPFWMPDHLASSCMECDSKFTVIKRRHHCRACGRILCSKCCGMRASLEYLQNQEQRVCETCFRTLAKVIIYELQHEGDSEASPRSRPNPNNPMEYCSTVPPPLQVQSSSSSQSPPSVLVPVGVLKREGSSKVKETPKQVMFSDGIRPGGDLTELDGSEDHRNAFRRPGKSSKRTGAPGSSLSPSVMLPPIDPVSQSFIVEGSWPPVYMNNKGETTYEENWPTARILEKLKDPDERPVQFAINKNLVAHVKITKLDCCMKETCWVICTKGMGCVGQDEIVVLLALNGEDDDKLPKEILLQLHYIYQEAARGNTVNELGYWCVKESNFLDSKQHGGFLFIRPTFQCLNRIDLPPPSFLVGILILRSEIPWARVFPFRLMLRLGAEFRYYPCPLVSFRFREPVYYEIGHTIINLLADFRNLSYTIPSVRGLKIHMEANQTSILIPRNRYDQVIRALNNSNDPVLALAGSFSPEADSHLVCMQSKGNDVTYSTHAININDKPRKVTGASFVVLNGALKSTSGMSAKSSIIEDGVMVQVPSDTMTVLRTKLRNMEDWSVRCGPIEGRNEEETVRIIWCEDDKNFNVGVKSVIDNMALDGVPSIRVHSGKDYMGCSKFIRWTQVFIIKCEDGATSAKIGDPLEVNKLSESIARATCLALMKLLELLAASGLTVLAVRATMDQENVGYEAGSNGEKLAPIYMNSLDNELIPILHKAASVNDSVAVLELIFHIMDQ